MKKLMLILMLVVCLAGCKDTEMPKVIREATPPLTIVVLNEEGVILKDGDNVLYSFKESYYFVQTLMASDLKAGDTLIAEIKEVAK